MQEYHRILMEFDKLNLPPNRLLATLGQCRGYNCGGTAHANPIALAIKTSETDTYLQSIMVGFEFKFCRSRTNDICNEILYNGMSTSGWFSCFQVKERCFKWAIIILTAVAEFM